ncbi:hypothetical protein HHK36_003976 [Tetracentron sinense]|uniref:GATA-type domain-containing protein n=1 Tax=Tetracentron sinense TaxID=13715 RepID=A0A834ZZJ2_TETSI|nr:hypothetical protein HHK36_003976 [Tetracentron sinense]
MTPIYLNPPPFPSLEVDNEYPHLQLVLSPISQASSSLSYPLFFNPTQDQGENYYKDSQHHQQEADKYVSDGGSSDHQLFPSASLPTVENDSKNDLKLSVCKQEGQDQNQSDNDQSVRWMSSKMRKMINSDRSGTDKTVRTTTQKFQDQHQSSSALDTDNSSNNSSNNSNNTIRVCSDCKTTKTPLWRSGHHGPKSKYLLIYSSNGEVQSLCNACGIRQRKARRAMAAAAAAANSTIHVTTPSSMRSKVHKKDKKSANGGCVAQYKKRCKLTAPPSSGKKLCFEDFTVNLSKNSAFHRVFPQDEKEAAILLMALSCGLVHG